jgi:hypothetical protein
MILKLTGAFAEVFAAKYDVRASLIRDVGEALRTYTDDDGIVFPAETYLAVARR